MNEQDLIYRLRKRAEIRRQSVQEGTTDRIADLLDEASVEIEKLREKCRVLELTLDQDKWI